MKLAFARALALITILAAAPAVAQDIRIDSELCADGTEKAAGTCPAQLGLLAPGNFTDTSADLIVPVNDRSDGILYTYVEPAPCSPPSPADLIACTGGTECESGPSDQGNNLFAFTALTQETSYCAHALHVNDVGWRSEIRSSQVWATTAPAVSPGTDLDVAGTFFFDDSATGSDDGSSPTNAWETPAGPAGRSWQDGDRLYFERTAHADFGASLSIALANNVTVGCYYMDGGIPVACNEGSSPSSRPLATSNAAGPNCADLPWLEGRSETGVIHATNTTGWVVRHLCMDGDLDTAAQKGFDGSGGLDTDASSSLRNCIEAHGTASGTIEQSHFEDAEGWHCIQIDDTADVKVLNITGGDHGYWRSATNPTAIASNQRDVGNFINIQGAGPRALVQGVDLRGGGHDLINVESCDGVNIRWVTLDGEVGAVGSDLGSKTLEVRANCLSDVVVEYSVFKKTRPSVDGQASALKARGDGIVERYNYYDDNASDTLSITSSPQHRTADDQCHYNNLYENYGSADDQFGAIMYLSDSANNPDDFYASRFAFLNNGVGRNLATTNPRFAHWNNSMDADPAESDPWNGHQIRGNRFYGDPIVRRAINGGALFTISQAEASYSGNFGSNVTGVDESALAAASGGVPIASITSATGSGTSFEVNRPRCFRDGNGHNDGDVIDVNGTEVEIISIVDDLLTVSSSVSWTLGDGVSPALSLSGTANRVALPPSVTVGHTGAPNYLPPDGGGGGEPTGDPLSFGGVENTDWTVEEYVNSNTATADVETLAPASGDHLTFALLCRGADTPFSTPPGWELRQAATGGNAVGYVWHKTAGASESDVAVTVDSDASAGCAAYVFKTGGGLGIDQIANAYDAGLDVSPSITPTETPSIVWSLWFNAGFSDAARVDGDQPAGMTFLHSGQGDGSWGAAYEEYSGTTATGTLAWSDENGGQLHFTFNVYGIAASSDPYEIQAPIPSGWEDSIVWPSPPTNLTTVSGAAVDTLAEIQAAVDTGNREIVVPDGSYGSLNIGTTATDIYLRAANCGAVSFASLTVHGSRIRIECVRVENGATDMLWGPTDVLFDDVYLSTDGEAVPTVFIGGSDAVGSRGDYARVAFINSTIRHAGDNAWPFLVANAVGDTTRNTDFIMANCFLVLAESVPGTTKLFRMGHNDRMILVDNWMQAPSSGSNQFRLHNDVYDTLISGNILIEGATQLFIYPDGDSPGSHSNPIDNVYITANDFYISTTGDGWNDSGAGPFTAMSGPSASLTDPSHATNNTQYAAWKASGSEAMNDGGIGWETFSGNNVVPYQAPPTRTAGASH